MPSLTEENYLKEICKLSGSKPGGVPTTAIAKALGIRAATVSDMLQRLSQKKLIRHEKYKGVSMTEKGRKVALGVIRKHRLWEAFLVEKLKFGWDEVHPIAEQLEHVHSDELTRRLDEYLGFPRTDPHGDPIPDARGRMTDGNLVPLSEVKPGTAGVIMGVADHHAAFLRYLEENQLGLGSRVKAIERLGYDESMHIRVNNRKQIHISLKVAANILLRSDGKKKRPSG